MARVLLFGAMWSAVQAALIVTVAMPDRPRPSPPSWSVTHAYSAHHAMVVFVETTRVADAPIIAAEVVEPLKNRYDEVLVYVRGREQQREALPARRVQWTPRGGFLESVYAR